MGPVEPAPSFRLASGALIVSGNGKGASGPRYRSGYQGNRNGSRSSHTDTLDHVTLSELLPLLQDVQDRGTISGKDAFTVTETVRRYLPDTLGRLSPIAPALCSDAATGGRAYRRPDPACTTADAGQVPQGCRPKWTGSREREIMHR